MEFFYKNLIWPLFKKFDHAYDAFLSIFEGGYSFLENLVNLKISLKEVMYSI